MAMTPQPRALASTSCYGWMLWVPDWLILASNSEVLPAVRLC
jgi:hypothetical protein